jgi:hypothetical protein
MKKLILGFILVVTFILLGVVSCFSAASIPLPVYASNGILRAPTNFWTANEVAQYRDVTNIHNALGGGAGAGNLYSVKIYGAVGDGITDDTMAVSNTVSTLGGAYFPKGTYFVTAPIFLPTHGAAWGDGDGSIVFGTNTSGYLSSIFIVSNVHDVLIERLALMGAINCSNAVIVDVSYGVTIQNVLINGDNPLPSSRGFWNSGVLLRTSPSQNIWDCHIINTRILSVVGDAVKHYGSADGSYGAMLGITDCDFTANTGHAVNFAQGPESGFLRYESFLVLRGSVFESSYSNLVYASDCSVTIDACYFEAESDKTNVQVYVGASGQARPFRCVDSVFEGGGVDGARAPYLIHLASAQSPVITGNVHRNHDQAFIRFDRVGQGFFNNPPPYSTTTNTVQYILGENTTNVIVIESNRLYLLRSSIDLAGGFNTPSTTNLLMGILKSYHYLYPDSFGGIEFYTGQDGGNTTFIRFMTSYGSTTEAMRINEVGQVGIGTATPTIGVKLDVPGTVLAGVLVATNGNIVTLSNNLDRASYRAVVSTNEYGPFETATNITFFGAQFLTNNAGNVSVVIAGGGPGSGSCFVQTNGATLGEVGFVTGGGGGDVTTSTLLVVSNNLITTNYDCQIITSNGVVALITTNFAGIIVTNRALIGNILATNATITNLYVGVLKGNLYLSNADNTVLWGYLDDGEGMTFRYGGVTWNFDPAASYGIPHRSEVTASSNAAIAGFIASTNLSYTWMVDSSNRISTYQGGSITISNLANNPVKDYTNRFVQGANITLVTNPGGIVAISATIVGGTASLGDVTNVVVSYTGVNVTNTLQPSINSSSNSLYIISSNIAYALAANALTTNMAVSTITNLFYGKAQGSNIVATNATIGVLKGNLYVSNIDNTVKWSYLDDGEGWYFYYGVDTWNFDPLTTTGIPHRSEIGVASNYLWGLIGAGGATLAQVTNVVESYTGVDVTNRVQPAINASSNALYGISSNIAVALDGVLFTGTSNFVNSATNTSQVAAVAITVAATNALWRDCTNKYVLMTNGWTTNLVLDRAIATNLIVKSHALANAIAATGNINTSGDVYAEDVWGSLRVNAPTVYGTDMYAINSLGAGTNAPYYKLHITCDVGAGIAMNTNIAVIETSTERGLFSFSTNGVLKSKGSLYPSNNLPVVLTSVFTAAPYLGVGGHWVGNSNGFLVDIYSLNGTSTAMKVLAP